MNVELTADEAELILHVLTDLLNSPGNDPEDHALAKQIEAKLTDVPE